MTMKLWNNCSLTGRHSHNGSQQKNQESMKLRLLRLVLDSCPKGMAGKTSSWLPDINDLQSIALLVNGLVLHCHGLSHGFIRPVGVLRLLLVDGRCKVESCLCACHTHYVLFAKP